MKRFESYQSALTTLRRAPEQDLTNEFILGGELQNSPACYFDVEGVKIGAFSVEKTSWRCLGRLVFSRAIGLREGKGFWPLLTPPG